MWKESKGWKKGAEEIEHVCSFYISEFVDRMISN